MAKTKSLALTSTFQAVVASSVCKTITVLEDISVSGGPNAILVIAKPTASDDARQIYAGTGYTFTAPGNHYFQPGDTVGYVKVTAGSTTGFQDEE